MKILDDKEVEVEKRIENSKVICLCGSLKFKELFKEIEIEESKKGNIVLMPVEIKDEDPLFLLHLHYKRMKLADEILIVNKDGYIGDSVKKEIFYAKYTLRKPIKYYEQPMLYSNYTPMHKVYTETIENEKYIICTRLFEPSFFMLTSYEYSGQERGDRITVLVDKEKNEVVMSDSVMEQRTNIDFVRKANGNVLIGGLGLGMVVLAIQDKPEVKSITVVEISKSLADLVLTKLKPLLNNKVNIVISDIHDFEPQIKYDTIYCDIWNNVTGDNYLEMKQLTKKFKYKVNRENKNCFLDHWRKADCKDLCS